MIDVSPGTPGYELSHYVDELKTRRRDLAGLYARAEGDAPVPAGATSAATAAYWEFRKKSRVNWAGKIVRARVERMKPRGFLTADSNDTDGDVEARKIWKRSRMQSRFPDAARHSAIAGRVPFMVDNIAEPGDAAQPVIVVEDPRQTLVVEDPLVPGLWIAAVKVFRDQANELDVIVFHTPGLQRRAIRKRAGKRADFTFSPKAFDWDPDFGGEAGAPTGLTRVPAAEAVLSDGVGVFAQHLDLLDSIDQGAFETHVIAAVAAWRQKAVNIPADAEEDAEGNPIDWADMITLDPGAVWLMPENTKFWESQTTDMREPIEWDKHKIRKLSEVTSTPLRTFHTDSAGGSAEGAASQREDQVFAVEEMCVRVADAACDVMSVAFEMAGDSLRADRDELEMVFEDPARRALSEIADAWSKTGDMDPQIRYTKILGLSPAEFAEVKTREARATILRNARPQPEPADGGQVTTDAAV